MNKVALSDALDWEQEFIGDIRRSNVASSIEAKAGVEQLELVFAEARKFLPAHQIWFCDAYQRLEDAPNDLKTCHALRYRRDQKDEDHVECGLYLLVKA